jgi:glycosyltransferase involved in cell wall biosynthesis
MKSSKSLKQDLTIVIPVYNEAESLPHFLPALIKTCQKNNWRVIFVNDGSEDGSNQILSGIESNPVVEVLRHKVNRGYGGALKTGLSSAKTRYVVTMDGDGQHQISDIEAIYQFALKSDADMLIGSRSEMEHINIYREMGKWIIRNFTRILVSLPVNDLNSGFKLYRTELVDQYLHLCPDSMAFSDVITLLFLNQGHLVLEFPISVKKRIAGSSSIGTYTAFQTIIEIIGLAMLVNPLRIFLPLSIICIAVGFLWGIPIVLAGRGVSVGAMLAIVLGSLFFFLGLIASQLASIRLHLASLMKSKNNDETRPPTISKL